MSWFEIPPPNLTSKKPELQYRLDTPPIAFDEEIIFGFDPAIHHVGFGSDGHNFTEIVQHIVTHWKHEEWLLSLLKRTGFTFDVYDEVSNPTGILEKELNKKAGRVKGGTDNHGSSEKGLVVLRFFLLRCAGVTTELVSHMFNQGHYVTPLAKRVRAQLAKIAVKKAALRLTFDT